MERLTQKSDKMIWFKDQGLKIEPCEMNAHHCRMILEKLVDYEEAEEQGLLVRLPVKIGDDIYVIPSQSIYGINIVNGFGELNRVYHQHIGSITFFDSHWYATSREEYGIYNEKVLNDIAYGITWFTDYEEAERKLEEMKK
mgnify:CR=1 FL=1|jgi:hypothetical protein|nr:MAG TPA: hypothetical protein [Caudoviricetes sp.]